MYALRRIFGVAVEETAGTAECGGSDGTEEKTGCSFGNICELTAAFKEDSILRSCEKLYNAVEIPPDFGRLDNETEGEKVRMYEEFWGIDMYRINGKRK